MLYANLNRACANNVSVVQRMPDVYPVGFPDGQSDVIVTSISVNTGTAYVHTTASLS